MSASFFFTVRSDMKRVLAAIARITRVDHGQDLLEYGILMALIAIVAMVGVSSLGNQIHTLLWQTIVQNF
jgi:Flp pilus assembly pilin Flp